MIILLKQAEDQFIWLTINEQGQIKDITRFSSLDQHPEISLKEYLVVILPGVSFLSTHVKVPKTRHSELIKAVPFALEDQLIEDINSLCFALGNFDEKGFLPVIVVGRNYFENELNEIRQAKLNPSVIIPDYLAIQKSDHHWSVAINNGLAVLRYSKNAGLSSEQKPFENVLSLMLERNSKPEAIDLYLSEKDKIILPFDHVIEHHEEFINSLAIDELHKAPPINLLQGKYRVRTKKSKEKNRWKYVTILFIVLMAVIFGGKIIEYFVLKSHFNALKKNVSAIYKEVYPKATEVIDPKLRLTRTVNNLRKAMSGNILLDLLGPTAEVLNQHSEIQLISLSYQNKNLTVTLRAKELSSLEKFSNELTQKGLSVQQNQLSSTDQTINAEFQIRKTGDE